MSGICGITYATERSVELVEVELLLEPLKRRGPDGHHVVLHGATGLGQASLATTPEALIETLPLKDEASGCIITADARIDNRAELLERLGLEADRHSFGDGELILKAYLADGTGCLDHLRGDFAFAIWDPRKNRLFCARDQVGMRQLIYHHQPGSLFVFATEPMALLEHPSVPLEIDEGRIGDFLEHLEARDLTSTFFVGLHRLPPAHALVFGKDGLQTWRYWNLQPQPLLTLSSDAEYAEAFLKVLTKAVRDRLRSPDRVGSMLSGGMDSGSVTAIAAQLQRKAGTAPLKTYSAIRSDPDCVESRMIRSALTIDHIEPSLVSLDDLEDYRDELQRLTEQSDEPFDSHMTLLRAAYLRAHHEGVKVMLDGVGGDTTLSTDNMVRRHLRQGNFAQGWREAAGERRFWGPEAEAWSDYLKGMLRKLLPATLLERRREKRVRSEAIAAANNSPLTPEFAERINMAQRREEHARNAAKPGDPDMRRIKRMLHPFVVVARERYDRTASALAIEPRDPFLDVRVLEFCLSLPQEQLQKDGWPKVILRRAMKGYLPDDVRWRVGKEHLGWSFTEALWSEKQSSLSGKEVIFRRRLVPDELWLDGFDKQGCEPQSELHLALIYLSKWWAIAESIKDRKDHHEQSTKTD